MSFLRYKLKVVLIVGTIIGATVLLSQLPYIERVESASVTLNDLMRRALLNITHAS